MAEHLTPDELSEIDQWLERDLPLPRITVRKMRAHIENLEHEVRYLRDMGKAYQASEGDLRRKLEAVQAELTGTRADFLADIEHRAKEYEGRVAQLERDLDDANTTIAALREWSDFYSQRAVPEGTRQSGYRDAATAVLAKLQAPACGHGDGQHVASCWVDAGSSGSR